LPYRSMPSPCAVHTVVMSYRLVLDTPGRPRDHHIHWNLSLDPARRSVLQLRYGFEPRPESTGLMSTPQLLLHCTSDPATTKRFGLNVERIAGGSERMFIFCSLFSVSALLSDFLVSSRPACCDRDVRDCRVTPARDLMLLLCTLCFVGETHV